MSTTDMDARIQVARERKERDGVCPDCEEDMVEPYHGTEPCGRASVSDQCHGIFRGGIDMNLEYAAGPKERAQ